MKKVFLLGRPGSGKSTASRYLAEAIKQKKITVERINDFPLLKEMFLADKEQKRFVPTDEGGFNAIDHEVLNEVLQAVELKVIERKYAGVHFVTIEFARDNYQKAFRYFSNFFLLTDSYVLFLDADIETCLYRVKARIANPKTSDDHTSFPEKKFRKYYGKNNRAYMKYGFKKDFPMIQSTFIDTGTISLENFYKQLDHVVANFIVE
ncbi:MAG TPA: hypothetical protein VLF89_02030 [Candidatus Saccharimonadales bacterium]|nr:hypothetical protein [Candidatus Saccharimonadales bacterium]